MLTDKRWLNKRTVERLAEEVYRMEPDGSPTYRRWVYRMAAWAIEDLQQELSLVYRSMGVKGIQSIPSVGPGIAAMIVGWMCELEPPMKNVDRGDGVLRVL